MSPAWPSLERADDGAKRERRTIEIVPDDDREDAATAAFEALIVADPTLHERLGTIDNPDVYVEEAVAIASAHGIALSEAAIRGASRPDPLGIGRFTTPPATLDRWPPSGWLPARSVETGGIPAFDWAWFGPSPLNQPFFEDSVQRFAPRPFNRMFRTRTTAAALVAGAGEAAGQPPDGFIYHMSRCGSTLTAQMLGADPSHIVLSEPEPFDAVVRWAMVFEAPLKDRIAALRAIVAALGRDRSGRSKRLIVKLDCWHTFAIPLLRAAFPDTPWVFVYRNPVEVVVSQLRQRGIQTVPGLLPPSIIDIAGADTMDADRYVSLVIARIMQALLNHWHVGGGLLVNYDELPGAVVDLIAPHFGFRPTDAERAAMILAATRDAKTPSQPFAPDASEKRRAATTAVEAIVDDTLDPLYRRIQALRSLRPAG